MVKCDNACKVLNTVKSLINEYYYYPYVLGKDEKMNHYLQAEKDL